jgi:transposase
MVKSKEIVRRVVQMVLDGRIGRRKAAELLEVTERTIRNYLARYLEHGAEGLVDRRRGSYRKIGPDREVEILALKLDRPQRSARWIRDRLKLPVTVEAVRRVLVKHGLSRNGLPRSGFALGKDRWSPF